jgi:hypothetical protein
LYPPQVADCGIGLSTAEGTTQQQGLEELDVIFNFLHVKIDIQNVLGTESHILWEKTQVLKRSNMALTLLKKDLDIYKLQVHSC